MADIEEEVLAAAAQAKAAASVVAQLDGNKRNEILFAMATNLRARTSEILDANAQDVALAQAGGVAESLIDRLMLDDARVESMASALEDLVALPDPVGRVLEERELYNGLHLKRISVPLGLVAVVYEARPNVTADAAGICIKAGNACILRGGSMAARSNTAIAVALSDAAVSCGAPAAAVTYLPQKSREATRVLMRARGVVDVLVPRGGAGLIATCVEQSLVPVIETGTGNCHVYVHKSADLDMAASIVENAKCRRYGVCNAAESLLIDKDVAKEFIPRIAGILASHGVKIHADAATLDILQNQGREGKVASSAVECALPPELLVAATEEDWGREYLAPEISIHVINGVDEAIAHIERYSTHHSDAIVATDKAAQDAFAARVDSAAVYINASTAFTDGGQFGLGAEIGISTQKLHARGPFATDALTTYKYVVVGTGQVRD
jgi:glutamate-5-semialdehyde dehydrogenase